MQFSSGATVNTNELFSASGVLRGRDTPVDSGYVFAIANSVPAVAGNFGYMQIWNPSGSGKVAFVDKVSITIERDYQVPFLTNPTKLTGSAVWLNMKNGGPAGITQYESTIGTSFNGNVIWQPRLTGGVEATFEFEFPFELPEDTGLTIRNGDSNSYIAISVQGRELDV